MQSRHSKLYCLCNRDIQNLIVCAVETFETLLFVQSIHSKLYCLCNRDIQNFIVCAVATFKTLLFVQSSHSKLFSLRVPSGAPYYYTYARCDCFDNLTVTAAFVVYAVLTDSNEEDEESRIKRQKDGGWLFDG